jgi:hypothetical protein
VGLIFKVRLLDSDLTNGERGAPGRCPIALALRRTLRAATHGRVIVCTVGSCRADVLLPHGPWRSVRLGPTVRTWLNDWDRGVGTGGLEFTGVLTPWPDNGLQESNNAGE